MWAHTRLIIIMGIVDSGIYYVYGNWVSVGVMFVEQWWLIQTPRAW